MPFEQFIPRTFSVPSVSTFAPGVSGVYGLSNASEWILIEETDNIREALLGHLQHMDASLTKKGPTGFVFEVCDRMRRSGRHERLTQEYGPSANRLRPRHR